tara:strand:+ start:3855 stop:4817 length:963 start_codon:yes stop_codon:yes gene_type:complete
MKIFRYLPRNTTKPAPCFGIAITDKSFIILSDICKDYISEKTSIIDIISNPSLNDKINHIISSPQIDSIKRHQIDEVDLLCPLDKISSLRDAYAFRQHVKTSRENRGLKMIAEFDFFPVYYYSNHNAVSGPGLIEINKFFLEKLDYELEVAIIIGKKGINIDSKDADSYIYGFSIMNDFSSRQIQMNEMKLNLGPAKGKDFATSIGPYIVTKDELIDSTIKTKNGNHYDIELSCEINKIKYSSDNLKNMNWTFAQIISQISKGTMLYPGDVIGSGTCGTGCLYEINSSKNISEHIWLNDGDIVNILTDKIGNLTNEIKIV